MVADEAEEADLLSCISWPRFLHTKFINVHTYRVGGIGRDITFNQIRNFRKEGLKKDAEISSFGYVEVI